MSSRMIILDTPMKRSDRSAGLCVTARLVLYYDQIKNAKEAFRI